MKDNAWFEGFAPRDNPEIVVVCLFEHGVHGQYGAPVVRDVIKAYFDKKARLSALRQQQNAQQASLRSMTQPGTDRSPRRRPRRPRSPISRSM